MKLKLFLKCANLTVTLTGILIFSLFSDCILGVGMTIQSVSTAALEQSVELKKQQKKLAIQTTEIKAAWAEVLPKLDT